ncbi:cellulase family glycosylhydrolase [Cesiribacter sp. SM1]|uniref:cellulase family glycosylhydrolase n=1 Tax=Cesiribacter sp. SM1 TaxID=2861196 RepID=UPI001CD28C95|nr:cellulase family glycosylhydrolase [Cesiribacter sp. SM1]
MILKLNIKRKWFATSLLGAILVCSSFFTFAQNGADIYVDSKGVMRWSGTKEEVKGFGVNYALPFAHAYRSLAKKGVSHEKAIDEDVYHFARLGLDLYRVHVWDTEISDSVGNLLQTEQLRLFDYAISKMKERDMKFIITPIAYWGNGWPEPDEPTPGFSHKYGKGPSLTHPEAIRAQENYLYQFLNHVNPYTGLAYKDDPDVIAFEISNEPHHGGTETEVTAFINRMSASMRRTGTQKPIFYNMSHSVHLANAYLNADVQGGTFQWYPTNLMAGHALKGNFLPHVDEYTIPFADSSRFKQMAKIVYEFDPADVSGSYMYPAMVRSFREAGLQLAAHFAYDAMAMAPYNTEYGTHYMNLPFAPQKALSLKIASEVFHQVPLYKDFGNYPVNTTFGNFRVSHAQDLAELVSEDKFFYTNHTTAVPPAPKKLKEVAGWGSSAVVQYEGSGAYFLDKLDRGIWRLEVMPDAIWVADPYGKTSPRKTVSVVNWRSWPISIRLPDLGTEYVVEPLNEGNSLEAQARGGTFRVKPGVYLLKEKGVKSRWKGSSLWKNIRLEEFVAPATSLEKAYVLHQPLAEVNTGDSVLIEAEIITADAPASVALWVNGSAGNNVLEMKKTRGYTYVASIPAALVHRGFLNYHIVLKDIEDFQTFPAGYKGHPGDWDFHDAPPYQLRVVEKASPLYLFDAASDTDKLMRPWVRGTSLVPAPEIGNAYYFLNLQEIPAIDPLSNEGREERDYSMRFYFGDRVKGRQEQLEEAQQLIFRGMAMGNQTLPMQLALVMKDGSAWGAVLEVAPQLGDYKLSLEDLKPVKLINLPRPYPGFLPYYFENKSAKALDLNAVESLQFSVGPGLTEDARKQAYTLLIESVRLE